jgi:phage FluMu gp28-like protein
MSVSHNTEVPGARETFFLPYQRAWIRDESPLKIIEKSRQIGISFADAYDSVRKVIAKGARLDVWISSRDQQQARLYLEDCLQWARVFQQAVRPLGFQVLREDSTSAHVLRFASGLSIYSLSSNPNALAGKRGHVKLDEFALHQDQRLLYRVAKPVTTWGGQLSLISTQRGATSVFNQLLREAREKDNPMGWSVHSVPLSRAVSEGLVERINRKTGSTESAEQFAARLRAGCVDQEQWLQEYCCEPADESSAFISFELIDGCREAGCMKDFGWLAASAHPLFLGVDVARKQDLCVLDVGERIGDVVWDRLRIELLNRPFAEVEHELYRLLELRQVKRACIDATGLGLQLAERARSRFGWKVEPVVFTSGVKEELAFQLRTDLEKRMIRLADDPRLHADLRGIRKEVTSSGNLRFAGESEDSHCDRFWAKALRQHAANQPQQLLPRLG